VTRDILAVLSGRSSKNDQAYIGIWACLHGRGHGRQRQAINPGKPHSLLGYRL